MSNGTTHTHESGDVQGVTVGDYVKVAAVLGACCVWLLVITSQSYTSAASTDALFAPIFTLVALVGVVWLLMGVFRNMAAMRGLATSKHDIDNRALGVADWVDRPARTFNNLMQAPTLFYLVCVFMMLNHKADRAQIVLAWTYVALRFAHAVVYIGWNAIHYRFATWAASCIVLVTLWVRFASQM
jgi:hypothetical protein